MANVWQSPDGKITKTIIEPGTFGPKPTENSICTIELRDIKSINIRSDYITDKCPLVVTIGEANTAVDREIDNCLLTMLTNELSSVKLVSQDCDVSFSLKLISYEFNGYVYEWDANEKFKISQKHKEKGIELFKEGRFIDASHRFSRGLKLLLSILIPVDAIPDEIDGIPIKDIATFRANLYNNLASCYLKVDNFETTIELCTKIIDIDESNYKVKALHKRGVAYSCMRDYENAKLDLLSVLQLDADNKAAIDKLQVVNDHLSKQNVNYASMVKKMFN